MSSQVHYFSHSSSSNVDYKHVSPISTSFSLSLYDGEPFLDPYLYHNIVGALQYCTITRPEISFSINKVF